MELSREQQPAESQAVPGHSQQGACAPADPSASRRRRRVWSRALTPQRRETRRGPLTVSLGVARVAVRTCGLNSFWCTDDGCVHNHPHAAHNARVRRNPRRKATLLDTTLHPPHPPPAIDSWRTRLCVKPSQPAHDTVAGLAPLLSWLRCFGFHPKPPAWTTAAAT